MAHAFQTSLVVLDGLRGCFHAYSLILSLITLLRQRSELPEADFLANSKLNQGIALPDYRQHPPYASNLEYLRPFLVQIKIPVNVSSSIYQMAAKVFALPTLFQVRQLFLYFYIRIHVQRDGSSNP